MSNYFIENRRCQKCTMYFPTLHDSDVFCSVKCGSKFDTTKLTNKKIDWKKRSQESMNNILTKYS